MFSSKHLLCIILVLTNFQIVVSQHWKIDSGTPPSVNVTGTSSLTDWTVNCAEVQDVPNELTFDPSNPGQIQEFSFKVPVEGMDGGRGSSMNDKILEAFKATEHPFVQYQQTAPATVISTGETGVYAITSTGTLTMAGTSKSITISSTGILSAGKLVISGNQNLKMSDFEITPPSAMFGQIKTNDDVVVSYEFQYLKQ